MGGSEKRRASSNRRTRTAREEHWTGSPLRPGSGLSLAPDRKLLKVMPGLTFYVPSSMYPRDRQGAVMQEIKAVDEFAAVCVPVADSGVQRKDKEGYEGKRRDEGNI